MKNKNNVNIPEEDSLADSVESFVNSSTEGYEREQIDDKGKVKEVTSKFKMSPKYMLIAIGAAVILIGFILFGDKIKSMISSKDDSTTTLEETTVEDQSGKNGLSGMLDAFTKNEEGTTEEIVEGDASSGEEGTTSNADLELILNDLKEYYPDYEIVTDDETATITLKGVSEGNEHLMVMNYNAEILSEDFTPIKSTAQSDDNTKDDKGTVEVSKSEYNKSLLSKPEQKMIIGPTNEDGTASDYVQVYSERLIVNYEKLPVKGNLTMVYAKVIDTGEEILFNIPLNEYVYLEPKGTTVINVVRAYGFGLNTVDSVTITNWQ